MERVKGIEPSYAAWEAAVLPLNYTRTRFDALAERYRGSTDCSRCAGRLQLAFVGL